MNEQIFSDFYKVPETTFNINGGVWYVGRPAPVPKATITDHLKVIII